MIRRICDRCKKPSAIGNGAGLDEPFYCGSCGMVRNLASIAPTKEVNMKALLITSCGCTKTVDIPSVLPTIRMPLENRGNLFRAVTESSVTNSDVAALPHRLFRHTGTVDGNMPVYREDYGADGPCLSITTTKEASRHLTEKEIDEILNGHNDAIDSIFKGC